MNLLYNDKQCIQHYLDLDIAQMNSVSQFPITNIHQKFQIIISALTISFRILIFIFVFLSHRIERSMASLILLSSFSKRQSLDSHNHLVNKTRIFH